MAAAERLSLSIAVSRHCRLCIALQYPGANRAEGIASSSATHIARRPNSVKPRAAMRTSGGSSRK
jgi:hypothetical protein